MDLYIIKSAHETLHVSVYGLVKSPRYYRYVAQGNVFIEETGEVFDTEALEYWMNEFEHDTCI